MVKVTISLWLEQLSCITFFRDIEVINSAQHGITFENVEDIKAQDITVTNSRLNGLYLKTETEKIQLQNINVNGKTIHNLMCLCFMQTPHLSFGGGLVFCIYKLIVVSI